MYCLDNNGDRDDYHLTAPVINLTPLTDSLKCFLRYISVDKKDSVLKFSTTEDLVKKNSKFRKFLIIVFCDTLKELCFV